MTRIRTTHGGSLQRSQEVVEAPELVAQRLESFTEIAGSDRGFGAFNGFGAVASVR